MQNHTIFKVIIIHAGAIIRPYVHPKVYYQTRYDDPPYHHHRHAVACVLIAQCAKQLKNDIHFIEQAICNGTHYILNTSIYTCIMYIAAKMLTARIYAFTFYYIK